ncbi:MAG: glycosyl transferase group 1 [uncultured bacterium]|nr:MAG: glycosyl transferase group 1 [uncultured bacterium]
MTRLLIDGRSLTYHPKGVGRYAYHLCCQLDLRLPSHWQMDILAHSDCLPEFPDRFRGRFISVPRVSEFRAGLAAVPKQIKKLHADILLRPGEGIGSYYGIPIITVCHDINEWIAKVQASLGQTRGVFRALIDKAKSFYIGRALRQSEYVLCNSEFIRQAIHEYYKVTYEKTKLAYCGVDSRFYELSGKIDQEKIRGKYNVNSYILTFATGDYRENFLNLPRIIRALKEKRIKTTFIIAGIRAEQSYAKKLHRECIQLGLIEGDDFIFEGFLGENQFINLVELYTAADFYLELSLHEGFGMQVAEAMACGTTCISSAKGALKEVIGEHAIILSNPVDVDDIVKTIFFAYQHKQHERNNASQIHYTRKFSWDSVGCSTMECLLAVAKKYGL